MKKNNYWTTDRGLVGLWAVGKDTTTKQVASCVYICGRVDEHNYLFRRILPDGAEAFLKVGAPLKVVDLEWEFHESSASVDAVLADETPIHWEPVSGAKKRKGPFPLPWNYSCRGVYCQVHSADGVSVMVDDSISVFPPVFTEEQAKFICQAVNTYAGGSGE